MSNPTDSGFASRPWGTLATNVALAAVAVAVALGLGEAALRVLGLGRAPVLLSQESRDFFVPSKTEGLVYEIRPGFVGRAFGAEVRINSYGMRSPERPLEKPAGVRRVWILGDSVAFGHGVGQAMMFSAILENKLSDAGVEGKRVEVINAAVPGYNAEQECIVLREKGFAWQPDVVLLVAVINDVEPTYDLTVEGGLAWKNPPEMYREIMEKEMLGRGAAGFLRTHLRIFGVLDRALRRPYLLTRRFLSYFDGLYAPDSTGWRAAQEAIRAMHRMCRARGVRFVLAYCPVPAKPEPEVFRRIREEYADFARREGMTFLDLLEAERSLPVRMITISLLDRHPNVLGHQMIAEALAPLVAAELRRASPLSVPERKPAATAK